MGAKLRAVSLTFGIGAALGALLVQQSMGWYRRDLFSRRPLRRLSALGYLAGHPSVEAVRLLRDYAVWEQHPMLRKRAQSVIRRMEVKLG